MDDDGETKKLTLEEVFAALDADPLPEDFMCEAHRDRSLPVERDLWSEDGRDLVVPIDSPRGGRLAIRDWRVSR